MNKEEEKLEKVKELARLLVDNEYYQDLAEEYDEFVIWDMAMEEAEEHIDDEEGYEEENWYERNSNVFSTVNDDSVRNSDRYVYIYTNKM